MTGVIGTINYRFADRVLTAPNTTPESFDLQRILREMADGGVKHVIMEVSSHALDLRRVDDCRFRAGIFTNLTQDHLDYHKTMEDYFQAKKRFFSLLSADSAAPGVIVNIDDPWGERICKETGGNLVTFGLGKGPQTAASPDSRHISAKDAAFSVQGIRALIQTPERTFPVESPLIGKFNLYNILAAAAAAHFLQVPDHVIREGIEQLKAIPGRMERVNLPGEPSVFVDYAHTEDALRRVLQNISEFGQRKIITVFGCGGDRDRGKRPLMGKAASAYSDLTVLTSDNPRSEDPAGIIREIEEGIDGSCKKYAPIELEPSDSENKGLRKGMEKGYVVIPERRDAIGTALGLAGPEDIVLIAGKGHETYQIIGSAVLPFDDRIVSREILDGLKGVKRKGLSGGLKDGFDAGRSA
jgi:UDP-N-acetylmuramoyl-L-alanyl-D-glutamate--2,6-diaminopimelate ligase